jgi:hypothetical protein
MYAFTSSENTIGNKSNANKTYDDKDDIDKIK